MSARIEGPEQIQTWERPFGEFSGVGPSGHESTKGSRNKRKES
jgi:hypothetical protein